MKVTVIGTGYVGLTTAAALAHLGHSVTCVDKNPAVVQTLKAGSVPIHEPGLAALFQQVSESMSFESAVSPEAAGADVILICVGTPTQINGDADLRYVEEAAETIAAALPIGADVVVANKSTVPVGSARRVESILQTIICRRGIAATVHVASNPEFLREGAALHDTLYPERVVVGVNSPIAANRLEQLYAPILQGRFSAPVGIQAPMGQPRPRFVVTTPSSAELAKYAANCFLAMKISFANEIGGIAERVGADVVEVMQVVGLDSRVGSKYLGAGVGWGGSCFGKDIRALLALGEQYNYEMPLAASTVKVNQRQRRTIVDKLQQAIKVVRGSTVALWGLTFKPNTDDLRDAPAAEIAQRLLDLGAKVRVYDPVGMARARREWPDLEVEFASSPLDAAHGADAVVLVTEWDEFRRVEWSELAASMRDRVVIDGRNALDPQFLRQLGFRYWGMGRGTP